MTTFKEKSDKMEDRDVDRSLPTIAEEPIGQIIAAIDKNKLGVSLDNDIKINAFIFPKSQDEIQLGSYVQVPTNRVYNLEELGISKDKAMEKNYNDEILGIVSSLDYVNRTGISEFNKGLNKDPTGPNIKEQYPLVAEIEVISVVTKNGEQKPIPDSPINLNSPPKPLTKLYPVSNEDYLMTGLKIPEKGLRVGFMSTNGQRTPVENPIIYKMKNSGAESDEESVLWRHCLICGSTGTGKTHAAKNILRQIHKSQKYSINIGSSTASDQSKEPCIIIIDPEAEYGQMKYDSNGDEEILDELKSKGVNVGGVGKDLKVFKPELKNSNRGYNQEVESFGLGFELVKNRPELILSFDTEQPTIQAIKNILNEFFQTDNIGNTYEDLNDWINSRKEERKNYLTNKYNMSDTIWDASIRRLLGDNTYETTFDTSDQSLTDIVTRIVQSGQISVIPTKHMNIAQQKLVVLAIMSMLAENKLSNTEKDGKEIYKKIRRTPIVLSIDEAHNYLSQGQKTIRGNYIIDKFINIAKQGRKYKLGLFMISQNPEDIHPEILKQTNSRFYLGLEGEILKNLNISNEIEKKVKNFGKGQMMIKSPGVRAVEVEGFRVCTVRHD